MATIFQNNTTIYISDEVEEAIDQAEEDEETPPIETKSKDIRIDGVTVEQKKAEEVRLNSDEGTSLRIETTGNTLLTGQPLQGTTKDPASIKLVTDGSKEVQVLNLNTSTVSNTVIETDKSVDRSKVAAAEIVVNSVNVEDISIKTASTEQKSQVRFDKSTESLAGAIIEMEGAGGNLDIRSDSVDNLKVKAAGKQVSEITFDAKVEEVSNAQIEFGQSGGSLKMKGGNLTSSTIAIDSDADTLNSVKISSDVESVTDTTLQLTKGASDIGIASATLKGFSVVANSKQPTSLVVDSKDVQGFRLSVGRSEASLDLSSENRIGGTTLDSSTKGTFNTTIDAVTKNTSISNSRGGDFGASFTGKAINLSISNEGKGTVEANFKSATKDAELESNRGSIEASFSGKAEGTKVVASKTGNIDIDFKGNARNPSIRNEGKRKVKANFESATKGAELESTRGAIEASFSGNVTDIFVDASTSKGDVLLRFDSKVTDANLNFGRGSDKVIFGGSFVGSSSVDLGSDQNSDSVTIEKPKKVKSPLTISNFGPQDVLTLGASTFTYAQISEFDSTDSFPSIFGDNIIIELA